jgi:signal transduction histidine kinase
MPAMATGYLAYRTAARRVSDVLAVLVAMASAIPAADHANQRPNNAVVIIAVLAALPLLVRRKWPVPVFGAVFALSVATAIWDNFQAVNALALLIALYTVAALRPLREALACAGVLFVAIVAAAVSVAGGEWWYDGIFICGLFGGALGLGLYSATRRDYLAGLTDRAERLERERDQQVALAAAAERARIAREMHDIVAHNLTVMVTLSEAAATSVPTSPARSAELMRSVSAIGRRALTDTRSLLGVLRQGPAPASPEVLPAPGLAQLDELADQVRAAGLDTSVEISGQIPDLPEGLQLTVYRLVQEALTNTLKHAGAGARAVVRLRFLPGEVRLEVDDDGAGRNGTVGPGAGAPGPGGGLLGMRERARAYGGDVLAGPREPHGWRVSAHLKLDSA